jgi:peptidyl-prolyl cis-trans isomerase C
MTKHSILATAIASALMLGGCNSQPGTSETGKSASTAAPSVAKTALPAPKDEDIAATVNGKPILKAAVAMQSRGAHDASAEEKILDELISRELLRQEAEKQNLTSDPAAAEKLDNMLRIAYSQIAAEHFMKSVTVSDEELKKEYDQRTAAMKNTEYKASHILVDNEAAAKDIIAKLQKGAKFDELAKKQSKDPGSKNNGGDLGWFGAQQMVAPFSKAVSELKNGEITQTPVQTQFGWHVIQREDSREQQPPALDAVKDQLKMMLQSQKLQQHIADLKTAAKIEKKAKPVPAAAAPATPAGEAAPAPAEAHKPAAAEPTPATTAAPAAKPAPVEPATPVKPEPAKK